MSPIAVKGKGKDIVEKLMDGPLILYKRYLAPFIIQSIRLTILVCTTLQLPYIQNPFPSIVYF